MKVKVTQSCPTLCDPMDYIVHAILQARILEWVAFPSPGDPPNPGIEPGSSSLQADSLPPEPQGKPLSMGFPDNSVGKESACNEEDPGLIPGSGRSAEEGNGNSLQYSCLENPTDRGAWQAAVHGVARVGHDLVSKPPPPPLKRMSYESFAY